MTRRRVKLIVLWCVGVLLALGLLGGLSIVALFWFYGRDVAAIDERALREYRPAQVTRIEIPGGRDGSTLRLEIRDQGSRLNVNALFEDGEPRDPKTEVILQELLDRTIQEMPGRPEDKFYDPQELARNLIDFIDEDEERHGTGGSEDDYYQRQDPPYRAENRPLLSLAELRLVEGFDAPLVDALEPYLTV